MGFFSRKKKASPQASAQPTSSPSINKKEPLLEESVPNDEPELLTKGDARPAWTDVDGHKAANLHDPEQGGDTDLSMPPGYRRELLDKRATFPERLQRLKEKTLYYGAILFTCGGASTMVLIAIYSALAVTAVALMMLTAGGSNTPSILGGNLNVAFIGNSYFFVNDLPRLFEKVTGDKVFQDSCLHGSGSILNILKTGNGMFYKWQSENAMQGGVEWVTGGNTKAYLYDYGACSVPQLLTGQDKMLSYQNQYGHYGDDGTNPCLMDNNYLDYENSFNYTQKWDYVVIVDQSKRMCFDDAREEALMGFNYTYGPILDNIGATPVIVQPHAFWSDNVNMTGLTDIPTFTSMIMEGATIYKDFLDSKFSSRFHSKSKIAPVGHAFLAVWEQDQDLWAKLFLEDGIHPSGYGSYLYAMVIHAAIYGFVPPRSRVVTDDPMNTLFSTARKLHSNTTGMPSKSEALTLWKIARKVVQFKYTPTSLETVSSSTQLNDGYANDDGDDAAYQDQVEYYNSNQTDYGN
jgi:hypothetical protein